MVIANCMPLRSRMLPRVALSVMASVLWWTDFWYSKS